VVPGKKKHCSPSTDQPIGTTLELQVPPMSSLIQQLRLDNLHALLVCNRIEKAGLAAEISSASTTPERKKEAINRYAQVVTELRIIGHDLGILTGRR
jgi:hypothetical protein